MLAGAPSLREIRARTITALEAATLTGNPKIEDSPVNPTDPEDLPVVQVFDEGRSAISNSASKLFRGKTILSMSVQIIVKAKTGYADILDQLTEEVLQTIITTETILEGIGKVKDYKTQIQALEAETPIMGSIISINLETQEKFVTASGNQAALQEVKTTVDASEDANKNITVTFNP